MTTWTLSLLQKKEASSSFCMLTEVSSHSLLPSLPEWNQDVWCRMSFSSAPNAPPYKCRFSAERLNRCMDPGIYLNGGWSIARNSSSVSCVKALQIVLWGLQALCTDWFTQFTHRQTWASLLRSFLCFVLANDGLSRETVWKTVITEIITMI